MTSKRRDQTFLEMSWSEKCSLKFIYLFRYLFACVLASVTECGRLRVTCRSLFSLYTRISSRKTELFLLPCQATRTWISVPC